MLIPMLETPHVTLGAAIATAIPNPFIAISLSLGSHFVLDKIPHWNPHTYTETKAKGYPSKKTFAIATLDILVALALGIFFASRFLPDTNRVTIVILSCLASVLPDVVKYPFFVSKKARTGIIKKWVDTERRLQVDTNLIPGILTQLTVVIVSLAWIFNH